MIPGTVSLAKNVAICSCASSAIPPPIGLSTPVMNVCGFFEIPGLAANARSFRKNDAATCTLKFVTGLAN